MENKTTATPLQLEKMAKILKTIAHPIKLEILLLLGTHERLDVSSICNKLQAGCQISMMSHHLSKMKDNGIVQSTKEGKQVYYELVDSHILSLFKCMNECKLV